jgi:hypothetical protein
VTADYPSEFWPSKPGGRAWPARGERDHARAVYDIAGVALTLLQQQVAAP